MSLRTRQSMLPMLLAALGMGASGAGPGSIWKERDFNQHVRWHKPKRVRPAAPPPAAGSQAVIRARRIAQAEPVVLTPEERRRRNRARRVRQGRLGAI